jgi:hypothetical protein
MRRIYFKIIRQQEESISRQFQRMGRSGLRHFSVIGRLHLKTDSATVMVHFKTFPGSVKDLVKDTLVVGESSF